MALLERVREVVGRLPVFKQLADWQNAYFQRYWSEIQNLSSPEELLKEQQRLDRQRFLFQTFARSYVGVGVGAGVLAIFNPEAVR